MGRGETNAKKRKRNIEAKARVNETPTNLDTSKPTAVFKPTEGRGWTVSVALPGSIIANAQSHELRTSLAGHVARALSVFCVDEVVIFSDGDAKPSRNHHRSQSLSNTPDHSLDEYTGASDPDHFLVHLLSYLETPPHLRRLLFPLHPNLRTAGTLPSLDLPHHLRAEEWCPYREGVTIPSEVSDHGTSFVEAGLRVPVTVGSDIPPSTRVTLKFEAGAEEAASQTKANEIKAEAVNPDEPREVGGYYWGYTVRRASSLSAVFEECTYAGGYDVTIGTSERGTPLDSLYSSIGGKQNGRESDEPLIGYFNHLLIIFGGVSGLETAVKNDPELQKLGVKEAKDVFDKWVNICPGQGSRTIRTEEAIWIGLMGLRRLVTRNSDVPQAK